MEPDEATALAEATRLWRTVQSYLRLTAPGDFDARDVPEAIRPGLARAAGALDFAALNDTLRSTETRVTSAYRHWIGDPAEALPPVEEQQPP